MRDPELVRFFDEDHAIDEQNSCCECGWYYGSPESFGEHLADALEAQYMLFVRTEGE